MNTGPKVGIGGGDDGVSGDLEAEASGVGFWRMGDSSG